MWYPLPGPIPAGKYRIFVTGYQPTNDAQLHADLLYRPTGGPDQVIASSDSTVPVGADGGLPAGNIDATVDGAAVPGAAGSLLVLRVKVTAGTSDYAELDTSIEIPL